MFNPLARFRKYEKIGMAIILLLTMITFVLCTGNRGDLSERLLQTFGGGQRGTHLATINGRKLFTQDLNDTKERRNIANEVFHKSADMTLRKISDHLSKEKDQRPEVVAKYKPLWENARFQIAERLKQPRYFDGGVNLDDLINFQMWLAEADRLGVNFDDETLLKMVDAEMFGPISGFNSNDLFTVIQETRRGNNNANETQVLRALRDEYRVRTVQLALEEAQKRSFISTGNKDADLLKFRYDVMTRTYPSLNEVWDYYKENRTEYNIALVPIRVENFTKDVGEPKKADLDMLFSKLQRDRYDPLSDKSGFEIPQKIKVEMLMADPESPFYSNLAKTTLAIQLAPPISFDPFAGPIATATRYGIQPAIEYQLAEDKMKKIVATRFATNALGDQDILSPILGRLGQRDPAAIASWMGAAATPDFFAGFNEVTRFAGFYALAYNRHQSVIEAGLKRESASRAPFFAALVGKGADEFSNLAILGMWESLAPLRQYLPVDVVKDEMLASVEHGIAVKAAVTNMQTVRARLAGLNRKAQFDRSLPKSIEEFGLTDVKTPEYLTRFDIEQSKELAPLLASYQQYRSEINVIEGRAAQQERSLKESDFPRLFFDQTEPFSVAAQHYQVKAWPPELEIRANATQLQTYQQNRAMIAELPPDIAPQAMQQMARVLEAPDPTTPVIKFSLFKESEKPILFWKTDEEAARIPENVDQVKDRVEQAWKVQRAREAVAIPRARDIAETLLNSGGNFSLPLTTEAAKLGTEPIYLFDVARLVRTKGQRAEYEPYTIPKAKIPYPTENTVTNLLNLYDLKEPITTGYTEIDNLNKQLFDKVQKLPESVRAGKYVQVLTNKPRTELYVAVVHFYLGQDSFQFANAFKQSFMDTFLDRTMEGLAKRRRDELLLQLRRNLEVWETDDKKGFNTEG